MIGVTRRREGAPSMWAQVAFLGVVLLGGVNAVAVGVANRELAPLWGATLRFGVAAALLLAIVAMMHIPLPRGRALTGSILYGIIGFAGTFGCIHWALVQVPPANAQTILALVPLLTFLFAVGQGLERFRVASLVGGTVALAGIAVIFGDRLSASTSLPALVAVVAGAACMAEANIVVKRSPKCHPIANIAVAMTVGAVILLTASMAIGEAHPLPTEAPTWVAVGYASLAGSAVVFPLFVYVVQRWTASAASYVMLLMPVVTVVIGSTITDEAVTSAFLAGGVLVLVGAYLGAFHRGQAPATAAPPPSVLQSAIQPGCA
jgi:drug/metabolite transporter (DMT)-like permease